MTDRHRRAARAVAARLAEGSATLAVVLHGSTVRDQALASSDVDLAVVLADGTDPPARLHEHDGLLVEAIARSEAAWRERFARPQPLWVYAFLEGELLLDRGCGAHLIAEAHHRYRSYRTPPEVKADLAEALRHGRAKLQRALDDPDDAAAGYWASVMLVSAVPDLLYAICDRPLPPPSRRFELLHDLPVAEHAALIDTLCTGAARDRLRAAAEFVDRLSPLLASPTV